jgi:hypothetical protein
VAPTLADRLGSGLYHPQWVQASRTKRAQSLTIPERAIADTSRLSANARYCPLLSVDEQARVVQGDLEVGQLAASFSPLAELGAQLRTVASACLCALFHAASNSEGGFYP